jgi:hypothetical protein
MIIVCNGYANAYNLIVTSRSSERGPLPKSKWAIALAGDGKAVLAVTADVDATGLQTLKDMIGKYEEILELLERKKCKK